MAKIQERNQEESQNKQVKNLNIFHRLFPEFEFNEVEYEGNMEMIFNEGDMRIMQNIE